MSFLILGITQNRFPRQSPRRNILIVYINSKDMDSTHIHSNIKSLRPHGHLHREHHPFPQQAREEQQRGFRPPDREACLKMPQGEGQARLLPAGSSPPRGD
jgi:hypothetical protein